MYLSYLNTQILFWTGPTGCNLVKLEWPEIDFDRLRAPQFLELCRKLIVDQNMLNKKKMCVDISIHAYCEHIPCSNECFIQYWNFTLHPPCCNGILASSIKVLSQ